MSSFTWADDSVEVFTTATGNAVFVDDNVAKVFIDWGDGTNQTLEYGVNQWSTLDTASASESFTHVYTKTGSFGPVIRTVNTDGFISNYYGSSSTNSDLTPYESVGSRISPITVRDGNPLATVKVENKTVLSGIDNNIFNEGPKDVYMYIPPIVDTTQPDQQMSVTVTARITQPTISNQASLGNNFTVDDITNTFVLGDGTTQPVTKNTRR